MPRERLAQCQVEDRAAGLTEHHIMQLKAYFTQCACQSARDWVAAGAVAPWLVGCSCTSNAIARCNLCPAKHITQRLLLTATAVTHCIRHLHTTQTFSTWRIQSSCASGVCCC
jgi:hypothetical protein